jgi:hypothetical protein
MRERRINPVTKKIEVKMQPEGLPAIWTTEGFCNHCTPFGECLGLAEVPARDLEQLDTFLQSKLSMEEVKAIITATYNTKPCV